MNSRLRRTVLRLLPPIFVDVLRWGRRKLAGAKTFGASRPDWEAVPDTDAVWVAHEGWSHESISDTQLRKWDAFVASVEDLGPLGRSHEGAVDAEIDLGPHNTIITFGYVLGRAAAGTSKPSVLDWGGGLGHYFVYARALHSGTSFDYVVKDLPNLCEVGQRLLPAATFISDDAAALARRYDLVFASSSVQYARDLYGLMAQLCAASSKWLMVTRTPFVETHDDFVVVQRPYAYGYLTEYACWFINRTRFVEFVCSQGFVLEREFLVAEAPFVPNAPEAGRYRGFLFRRTSATPFRIA